jgi:hypothetical protein
MTTLWLIAAFALGGEPSTGNNAGPLVQSLWLVQQYGTPAAANPANDRQVKGALAKSLGKDGTLALAKLEGFMESETIKKLAGAGGRVSPEEIKNALDAAVPESRKKLLPRVREHADFLTTSFDMIDEQHWVAGAKLADWIATNYQPGKQLNIIVVCTGNSRRSILGATMGNIVAAYYGMPDIRFHSGGTAPTAFNSRTVDTLKAMGVEIEATGEEAERADPQMKNPIYRVRWGTPGDAGFETIEFSKRYDNPANPQRDFAALMVCGEADAACPVVKGAALRISMPYLDPKIYDGGAYEPAKYAERRDDMGRLMLASMVQARRRIASFAAQGEGRR